MGFDLCGCERSVRRLSISQMFHLSHALAGSGSYVRRHVGIVCSAVFGLREDRLLERKDAGF